MLAYRVADIRRAIFDPTGAFLRGGRWNSPGHKVIYAAQTYAGALLEILVHQNLGEVPLTHGLVIVSTPDDISIENAKPDRPAPVTQTIESSRYFGDRWLAERRSAILLVPSVVLRGREHNILFNPAHPEFPRLVVSDPEPVDWDERLFRAR